MSRRVLVVEDNQDIAHVLAVNLGDLDCEVDVAGDGVEALRYAENAEYDLIVLDLMLPRLDGLEVCRRLRAGSSYVPIIMLTAKSGELDRVLGLELGADDYIVKPFSVREVLARVKALFRRMESLGQPSEADEGEVIEVDGLRIRVDQREVSVDGRVVELTAKEFDLLLHFARHPGRVYNRAQLLDRIWGYGHEGYEHTVNSHINRLRSKIEANPSDPHYVLTVWGVGYKFRDPVASRAE